MKKHVDRGEFFPYINGRYVNPYAKKEKNPTIRYHKEKDDAKVAYTKDKTYLVKKHA